MRDKKISILLLVSFLLLLASFLILCTWVYNYYTRDRLIVQQRVAPARTIETRDSLLKIYTSSIQNLENQLGNTYFKSDSIESGLSMRLDEYYRLKTELSTLLKNPTSNDDFKLAKVKITELQKRIEVLLNTSSDIQRENARLYKLLEQMNKDRKSPAQNAQYIKSNDGASRENSPTAPFSTSELSLQAVKEENEEQDIFSNQRNITGSFVIRNAVDVNTELIVVILQPNGAVLQKSTWESGAFQTSEGKKVYSLKINCAYTKGEAKKLSFAITAEKFIRGTYTMQIYNNGTLIGRTTKSLS